MVTQKSKDEFEAPHYQDLIASLIMGVVAFSSIGFVIYRLGVSTFQAVGFSLLCGVAVTAFILRERSLMNRISEMDHQHVSELGLLSARLEFLYQNSSAGLVQYEAGTLMVERASVGFLDLMKVRAENSIRGRRLEEVLGIGATTLESVTDAIRTGELQTPREIVCTTAGGDSIKLLVAGNYLKHRHVVEATFQLTNKKKANSYDVDRALGDLERFRHGMARREHRILELKGEVNELLLEAGEPVRYKVDNQTENTRDPLGITQDRSLRGGQVDA